MIGQVYPHAANAVPRKLIVLVGTISLAAIAGAVAVIVPDGALAVGAAVLVFTMAAIAMGAMTALLWLPWLLAAEVRRIVESLGVYSDIDVLSVVPFMVTFAGALITWKVFWRAPRTVHALGFTLCGALVAGVPMGIPNALALAFALVAYGSLLAAFMLGASLGTRGEQSFARLLAYTLPMISVIAVAQAAGFLFPWDQAWVNTVASSSLVSIQISGSGALRVFGTLNSPGTLAAFLAITLPLLFAVPGRLARPAVVLVLIALLLTQVRAAWVAAAVAIFVYLLLSSRGSLKAPLGMAVCVGLIIVVASLDPSGTIDSRISSFSSLESDVSLLARLEFLRQLGATIAELPLGLGLGSVGLPSVRLAEESRFGTVDNGYASLLLQLGVVGFILFFVAVWLVVSRTLRLVRVAPSAAVRGRVAAYAAMMVLLMAGDAMYGVSGVVFWFLAGVSITEWSITSNHLGARDEVATASGLLNSHEDQIHRDDVSTNDARFRRQAEFEQRAIQTPDR